MFCLRTQILLHRGLDTFSASSALQYTQIPSVGINVSEVGPYIYCIHFINLHRLALGSVYLLPLVLTVQHRITFRAVLLYLR